MKRPFKIAHLIINLALSIALTKPVLSEQNIVPSCLHSTVWSAGNLALNLNSVIRDLSGNYFLAGPYRGNYSIGGDSLPAIGGKDLFLIKYDSCGNQQWVVYAGSAGEEDFIGGGRSIATDSYGNIYIVGRYNGDFNFYGTAGTVFNVPFVPTANPASQDGFLVKLDPSGQILWGASLRGGSNDGFTSIVIDHSDNPIVAGGFNGCCPSAFNVMVYGPNNSITAASPGSSYGSGIMVKFDPSGNILWNALIFNRDTEFHKVTVDSSDNIYAVGSFRSWASGSPATVVDALGTNNTIYNPGIGLGYLLKLSSSGQWQWGVSYGNNGNGVNALVYGEDVKVDEAGNPWVCGTYSGNTCEFFSTNSNSLIQPGSASVRGFIVKYSSSGVPIAAENLQQADGSTFFTGLELTENTARVIGYFNGSSSNLNDALIANFSSSVSHIGTEVFGGNGDDYFNSVVKDGNNLVISGANGSNATLGDTVLSSAGTFVLAETNSAETKGVYGKVFNDLDTNCTRGLFENGLEGVRFIINPGNYVSQSNAAGIWKVDSLPAGIYTVIIDTSNGRWSSTCPVIQNFTVINTDSLIEGPDFGIFSVNSCSEADVSISTPFIRRCFTSSITVNAFNSITATGPIDSAYVIVNLDPVFSIQSVSQPYNILGQNEISVYVGTLLPGQSFQFLISALVDCNATLSQTVCMEARMFPVDSCSLDTIADPPGSPCTTPWDRSSLSVDGWCQNDTVYFTITNNGSDMSCYMPVRIFIDGQLFQLDSVMLAAGESVTYTFAGTGQTFHLEADQHPLHPGNSRPNATVELCGPQAMWTPNLVSVFRLDDADPVVDIHCGLVVASYDPNDKKGYPLGLTSTHDIQPGQQLQYQVRFQNTGTDTAYSVVVRDTLDEHLDIFSVIPGTSSHLYTFRMYGQRVLEWTFWNILLPDSNVDEPGSHGFLTYTVNQVPGLNNGTLIYNDADIYFDFNDPVTTNQTFHTINRQLPIYPGVPEGPSLPSAEPLTVFPNPTTGKLYVLLEGVNQPVPYQVADRLGRTVKSGVLQPDERSIDLADISQGIYFLRVEADRVRMAKFVRR